jgi:hypothetical protein
MKFKTNLESVKTNGFIALLLFFSSNSESEEEEVVRKCSTPHQIVDRKDKP